jgi:tetratricopeptide (TPR) repeat protein
VLIKEWASTGDPKQIDAWLVERAKVNPYYWMRERLRFRKDQGTAGEFVEEMSDQVRKQPHNAEVAHQFLEVMAIVGTSERDIAWLGDVCRPPSAYASYRLGQSLRGAPRAAIALLEHSLAMPVTKEDEARLQAENRHRAVALPAPPPAEPMVRRATKRELLRQLHAVGESARAQKLLEELASAEADGLPPDNLDALAGQIQAASGARVVQQRFQAAEVENKENAEYWQSRARYFTGRKEYSEAIAAYEKAMELSERDPDNVTHRSSGRVLRSFVLSNYVALLLQADRKESAKSLLERELQNAPPDGIYVQRIMDILISSHNASLLAFDRERLWGYLATRTQWTRTEERLLWQMVEQPADQSQQSWQRAEELARDRDPSRSLVLGWVMTRSRASSRGIPWLKSAWQRLEKGRTDERQKAAFNLFGAYLDVGDWRNAEEVWPVARQQLTATELPDWLGRIALAAARTGEPAEAMRIWKQRTNLDRGSAEHVDVMLQAGLREQLVAFYRSLKEADPDCQSIEPVLKRML